MRLYVSAKSGNSNTVMLVMPRNQLQGIYSARLHRQILLHGSYPFDICSI